MSGQRHLIDCHCILPIYKNSDPVVYHKFAVYSKLDEKTGKVIPKYVNCNNCGITHVVEEFCKSKIQKGKEDITSIRNIYEIEISLPEKLVKFLKQYNSTIDIFEEVEDVFNNKLFPRNIVIKREIIAESYNLKILNLMSEEKFTVSSEILNDTILYQQTNQELT